MDKIKSSEILLDFMKFCVENPEYRFWQALYVWCGKPIRIGDKDPFYWETKTEK